MKGALVFLLVFAILVVLTLGNVDIPPGKAIYLAVLPGTEAAAGYLVGGSVDAITAIIAVFNGVIYGFIAWLIFTILMMLFGKKEKKNVNVNVTVNNNQAGIPPPPPQQ
jgi:heme/copper-type cytochrome/quinol oxidase subunit 3